MEMRARDFMTLLVFTCLIKTQAQTTHLIRGFDFYYDPDTVIMMAGDSIHFQTQGIHDMVETDSASWAINQAISNGGFFTTIGADTTFVIDTVGTYYFVCSPHGFVGMKGVLLVADTLVTGGYPVHPRTGGLRGYPVPLQNRLILDGIPAQAHFIELFDGMGRSRFRARSSGGRSETLELSDLPKGIVLIVLTDEQGSRLLSVPMVK